jgi:hypothetical protein
VSPFAAGLAEGESIEAILSISGRAAAKCNSKGVLETGRVDGDTGEDLAKLLIGNHST